MAIQFDDVKAQLEQTSAAKAQLEQTLAESKAELESVKAKLEAPLAAGVTTEVFALYANLPLGIAFLSYLCERCARRCLRGDALGLDSIVFMCENRSDG